MSRSENILHFTKFQLFSINHKLIDHQNDKVILYEFMIKWFTIKYDQVILLSNMIK